MKFDGQAIQLSMLDKNIGELQFNLKEESVNKFNAFTLKEFRQVVDLLKSSSIQGLIVTSKKDCFIVGADVTEFLEYFKKSDEELAGWLGQVNSILCDLEDLNFPTVTAINGIALGGGFEMALATSFRVMSSEAKVGLPETKLGIYPGWGGTVRLSRLVGADNAIEWIASGEQWKADAALKVGAVDSVVAPDQLRSASLSVLESAMSGSLDWKKRRTEKVNPLQLNSVESMMVFEGAKAFVAAQAGPHYPAPIAAIEAIQKGAALSRQEALKFETAGFIKVAKGPVAHALVSLFLGDQYLKKKSKTFSQGAPDVKTTAVLGAGIMGGGVAYQTASKGIPIAMKDIQPSALDLGMREAVKLLDKLVSRQKMSSAKMGEVLSRIRPTLSYGDFGTIDFVVEAVVENEKVKKSVLAEAEGLMKEGAVLSSNTSTLSITRLAEGLKHPENFCGVHFFNPVHRMPLVEIIRGKKSSDRTIAAAVDYALKIGKTPIVVNDCAGFLVNRILFPYFAGFFKLLNEGVDFQRIDKVMEKWGWPMGPGYLLDVVGIDTAHHANSVMANEYPDRMKMDSKSALQVMFDSKRFGQKNLKGFYSYVPDKKGAPKKEVDPATYELLKQVLNPGAAASNSKVTDDEIRDRMMLPMVIEASRCLEDKIVSTPIEVDLGLIYGLGFPPFRGGALRYADSVGVGSLCKIAEGYHQLGKLYEPTKQMNELARSNKGFYL